MSTTKAFGTAQLHELVPLAGVLGIEGVSTKPAEVVLSMSWEARLCTAGGVLHGGALMSLADTAGAVCAFLNLPEGAQGTTTVESKTNLLAAVREGRVTATARALHAGGRFIVVETEVRDEQERLVAKTTQTQAVLR